MVFGLLKWNCLAVVAVSASLVSGAFAQVGSAAQWPGYGGNAQHNAVSFFPASLFQRILWSTPVDTAPPYHGNDLYIHYGEPMITPLNTIVVSVRQGDTGLFNIEGHDHKDGRLIWSESSGYVQPNYSWIPSFSPSLLPTQKIIRKVGNRVYIYRSATKVAWAEIGGQIAIRDTADGAASAKALHAFYGDAAYAAAPDTYNANVKVSTPLTVGRDGSVYFGYTVSGATPLNLKSGLAVVHPNGTGAWVAATDLAGDPAIDRIPLNCAPAIDYSGQNIYVATSTGYNGTGYLVRVTLSTLTGNALIPLRDPKSGQPANILGDSTASPTVSPDGTVFYGVFESPWGSNHYRGWMLHFDGALTTPLTPGAFGWDDSASIVPSFLVGSYTGLSPILIMTKYNHYAGTGGDGVNKIAILDPGATQVDSVTGANVMKEVIVLSGQTPDDGYRSNGFPNAVREWCINSAAVDYFQGLIIANCEDGVLYKWDIFHNKISETMRLTSGIGEAYTPTAIGVDGTVYAINNAQLFAVGGRSRFLFWP